MFFKAYLTCNLLKNKHLTLTTITHINTSQRNEGFLKQIESLISQNYFLKLSFAKTTNVEEDIEMQEIF